MKLFNYATGWYYQLANTANVPLIYGIFCVKVHGNKTVREAITVRRSSKQNMGMDKYAMW